MRQNFNAHIVVAKKPNIDAAMGKLYSNTPSNATLILIHVNKKQLQIPVYSLAIPIFPQDCSMHAYSGSTTNDKLQFLHSYDQKLMKRIILQVGTNAIL